MNDIKYICGLPGFGSYGEPGNDGDRGPSFHFIDNSIEIDKLSNYLLHNDKFNKNDLYCYNNALYIIDEKSLSNGTILYKNICNNQLNHIIKYDNYINSECTLLLSDKIKTKNEINGIKHKLSPLTLLNNKCIDYINNQNDNINFIQYDTENETYTISDNNSLISFNDLYINSDYSNILTEKYGFNELQKLIKSYKFNESTNKCNLTYKVNDAFKYRVVAIRKNNDNDTISENILIDFNDNITEFNVNTVSDILYKIYLLSDYTDDYNGYIISHTFNINTKFSKLENAQICYNDNNGNIIYNDVISDNYSIIINDKKLNDEFSSFLYLEFSNDSNTTIYKNYDNLNIEKDNNIIKIELPNDKTKIYKINIGHITYSILYYSNSNDYKNLKLNFKIEDSKKGYLGYNSNYNGVPLNGILQVYDLNFYSLDYNSEIYNINYTIDTTFIETPEQTASINKNDSSTKYECSIYHKMIKKYNDVYLDDIDNAESYNVTLTNNETISNISEIISFDNNIDIKTDTNYSPYKLIIYYEFNDPFYGLLNTNITVNIESKNENEIISICDSSINKKTLMIPWEIIGFVPKSLNSSVDYDLSIRNMIKRYGSIIPNNFKELKINPIANDDNMKNHTLRKYNYMGYKTDNYYGLLNNPNHNIYADNSFLTIAYDLSGNGDISYFSKYPGELKTSNIKNFSQCDFKYPIWVKTPISIKVDKYTKEYYSDIIPPSGTEYTPISSDNYMVDLSFNQKYSKYKEYFNDNSFVGFVEWSLNRNSKIYNNEKIISEKTLRFPFSDIKNLNKNEYNTLYSMYWDVEPRIIKSSTSEILYDYAINLLKQPKIFNSDKNTYYLNELSDSAKDVFNTHIYNLPINIIKGKQYIETESIKSINNKLVYSLK